MSSAYNSYADIFGESGTATVLTTYDWEVDFYRAPAILTSDSTTSDAPDVVLNKAFKLRTINWQAPDTPDNAPVTINIRGHQISQPGMNNWAGQVSFMAQDFSDLTITKYFNIITQAQDSSRTHSTRTRNPNSFRFGFYIYRLNPQGYRVMRWKCEPCIMVAFNGVSSGESVKSPATQAGVTFQVDHFEIEFPKEGQPLDGSSTDDDWTSYAG